MSRTIAYGLDALIVAVGFTGAAVVAGMIASVVGAQSHDLARAAASAFLLVLPAALALYSALFWVLAGRTPGMALLGLRVVATGRRSVSWMSALVRALVLAYFPVGAVWALVDRRHQGVHDKIARTAVVRVSPAASAAGDRTRVRPAAPRRRERDGPCSPLSHPPRMGRADPAGGDADPDP